MISIYAGGLEVTFSILRVLINRRGSGNGGWVMERELAHDYCGPKFHIAPPALDWHSRWFSL